MLTSKNYYFYYCIEDCVATISYKRAEFKFVFSIQNRIVYFSQDFKV